MEEIRLSGESCSFISVYSVAGSKSQCMKGSLSVFNGEDGKTAVYFGINDNLGHKAGDAAIIGIANTLKSHFQSEDVLARVGGDEFIVFLPGAAKSVSGVDQAMKALLRKLSSISVGENNERTIHCSAGCAVEVQGVDTYDSLFKRADTALYHVKRNGKNNFAFYEKEMEREDFEFYSRQMLSVQSVKKFELAEMQHLLNSIAGYYQLMLSVNLSANSYCIMEEIENGVFSRVPAAGALHEFINLAVLRIHPEDKTGFFELLSRDALLEAYKNGETNIQHNFRFMESGQYRWLECIVIFYTNDEGDVCDFTMIRWADERVGELEFLHKQKMADSAVTSSFETLYLINVETKRCRSLDEKQELKGYTSNSVDFEMLIKMIDEKQLSVEAQEAYQTGAGLEYVLRQMEKAEGHHFLHHTMEDGITRECIFSWYDDSRKELLLTVRKLTTERRI